MSRRSARAVPTARFLCLTVAAAAIACAGMTTTASRNAVTSLLADTIEARRLFESNIDAIHKRDRARYLATYLHSSSLARNGPAGLELGYETWSARRDST